MGRTSGSGFALVKVLHSEMGNVGDYLVFCSGVACYALRRKAQHGSRGDYLVFCRGVACYARNSVRNACRRRGVNHHSAPLVRIAGVARYTPTEEGKTKD